MPTHRPFRPRPARLLRRAAPLVVLSAVAVLANFSWTSTHQPDPFAYQRLRRRDLGDTPGGQQPPSQHRDGETAGSTTGPIEVDRPVHRPPAHTVVDDDTGGNAPPDHRPEGEARGGNGSGEPGSAADVDEQTATAERFVTAALDGRLGDAHQQAAQTAVTVATEHGFVDDPTRVAEALVVFLHPDHR